METLATSLDDSMERLGLDAARISGRSARIKRRVDMILEEIQGVRMNLGREFVCFFFIRSPSLKSI